MGVGCCFCFAHSRTATAPHAFILPFYGPCVVGLFYHLLPLCFLPCGAEPALACRRHSRLSIVSPEGRMLNSVQACPGNPSKAWHRGYSVVVSPTGGEHCGCGGYVCTCVARCVCLGVCDSYVCAFVLRGLFTCHFLCGAGRSVILRSSGADRLFSRFFHEPFVISVFCVFFHDHPI